MYRKINCPETLPSNWTYRLVRRDTGEVKECSDLAPLLRAIAEDARKWDILPEWGLAIVHA